MAKKQHFTIDLSSINFPTDQITLGQMRKVQPQLFTTKEAGEETINMLDAVAAMETERELATAAFAAVVGLPDPSDNMTRHERVAYLTEVYKDFGITTGRRQTAELVRRFEAEASRLAQKAMGEGRG